MGPSTTVSAEAVAGNADLPVRLSFLLFFNLNTFFFSLLVLVLSYSEASLLGFLFR